jgi:hypothetical protein
VIVCSWCENEFDPDKSDSMDPLNFCGGICEDKWHEHNNTVERETL